MTMRTQAGFLALLVGLGTAACGGGVVGVGGGIGPGSSGAGGDDDAGGAGVGATTGDDAGTGGGGGTAGPTVAIRLRSTAAAFPHDDGLAGQTPSAEKLGIRALVLSRGQADPAPWTVFDYGANAHEASLDDQADTVVASVPASQLHDGHYTIARVAISHVRYTVSTLVHDGPYSATGDLDTLEILSAGSIVDGASHARGWFTQTLRAAGQSFTRTGDDAPVPAVATTGGITLDTSNDVAAYVFPVDLPVNAASVTHDESIVLELNVDHDFRWRDQAKAGYIDGAWDTTPPDYEPIVTFGANSFRVYVE